MVINLSKNHSLVSEWIGELRDLQLQADRMRFRKNLERIAEIAAFEISAKLEYENREFKLHLASPPAKC